MILTVDIGNSRIKWALWQADDVFDRGVAAYKTDKLTDAFNQMFSAVDSKIEAPSQVFAVCVAGNELRHLLSESVSRRWQLNVEYLKTEKQYKNITNAYADPGQHGADRWAGMVAGYQSFSDSAVCVISAGTAITFDLINKSGQHLGGYILPSYVTMHNALINDTSNVVSTLSSQYKNNKNSVPDNTNDAVNEGLHKLLQAGIRELCHYAQQVMGEPMQIILTGGFANTIMDYPDMPAMHHKPDLVMQGLYDIMKHHKNESAG
jgi:type III pantothenate kinase